MKKVYITFVLLFTCLTILVGCISSDIQGTEAGRKNIQNDLDRNGTLDSAFLKYDGDQLVLQINNSNILIPEIDNLYTDPLFEEPQLHIFSSSDSKEKQLIVTIIRNVNKIGTKVGLWSFTYQNDEIAYNWSLDDLPKENKYSLSDYSNQTIKLSLPELNIAETIHINEEYYDEYLMKHLQGNIEVMAYTMYFIADYNNDGFLEIALQKNISTGAYNWLPFSRIYEIYEVGNGSPKLLKAFPNYSSNEKKKYIIEKIVEQGYYLYEEQYEDVLTNLIEEGIIIKNNNKYSLNIK